jgi:2'-5' RNA ligase
VRLFVALRPPAAVMGELARALSPLAADARAGGLRWTGEDGWHVTLAFLGEVDPAATLPALTERLARAARRHPPMTLRLAGGGRFGTAVLWTGVTGDTAELSGLAASVAAGARRAGVALDDRAFRAHVTLARGRPGLTPVDLRGLADRLTGFASAPWTADRVELIRSHPPAPGVPGARPRYETLTAWELGGGPAPGR